MSATHLGLEGLAAAVLFKVEGVGEVSSAEKQGS